MTTNPMLRYLRLPLLPAFMLGLVLSPTLSAQENETITPKAAEIAPKSAQALLTAIAVAGDHLVAVGSRGHILVAEGGSERWKQVEVPVRSLLTEVQFVDADTGWAVGHDATILKTNDGGQTWSLQNFDASQEPLLSLYAVDAQHVYAFGAFGLMLETRDGGTTWDAKTSEVADEGVHLNAVTALGDGSLLLAGEMGMLALSQDQGETWQRLPSPYESSYFAAAPRGDKGAVVAGLRGNLYLTDDVLAGEWTEIATGSVQSIFSIVPEADGSFVLVGLNATLQRLGADGSVTPLSPQRLKAAAAQDIALPYVALQSNGSNTEAGAYADAVGLADGVLVTVGDTGIRRWQLN